MINASIYAFPFNVEIVQPLEYLINYKNIFMFKYIYLSRLKFIVYTTYKSEFIAAFINACVELYLKLTYWNVLGTISNTNLVSYFMIVSFYINLLSINWFGFANIIGKSIADSTFSNKLIKPINSIYFTYSEYFAKILLNGIPLSLFFIYGLYVNPPISIINVLFSLLLLFNSWFISFWLNILVSCIYFYTPVASSIKNLLALVVSMISGAIIPITFFPSHIQNLLSYTPFPYLLSAPINALYSQNIQTMSIEVMFSSIWGLILYLLGNYLWNRNIKFYEANGM